MNVLVIEDDPTINWQAILEALPLPDRISIIVDQCQWGNRMLPKAHKNIDGNVYYLDGKLGILIGPAPPGCQHTRKMKGGRFMEPDIILIRSACQCQRCIAVWGCCVAVSCFNLSNVVLLVWGCCIACLGLLCCISCSNLLVDPTSVKFQLLSRQSSYTIQRLQKHAIRN